MLNGITTAKHSLENESQISCLMTPPSSVTFKNSTKKDLRQSIGKWLQDLSSSQVDSPVQAGQVMEKSSVKPMQEICGQPPSKPFAKYDRNTSCWKTFQGFLPLITSGRFLGKWPKQGMIVDGIAYRLLPLVRGTKGNGCGLCAPVQHIRWGIPTSRDWKDTGELKNTCVNGYLGRQVLKGIRDTNTKQKFKLSTDSKKTTIIGVLNPTWVCWLMSYPINWTNPAKLKALQWLDWQTDPADEPNTQIPRTTTETAYRKIRLQQLGNAVVPQCVAFVLTKILKKH